MHHCEHKWWDLNLRHHYRECKYCFRIQYNYTGEWKDEIKLTHFINNWTTLDGPQDELVLNCNQKFEFQCYESWGQAFTVTLCGQTFGPFGNLNQADKKLREVFGDHPAWMGFQPPSQESPGQSVDTTPTDVI